VSDISDIDEEDEGIETRLKMPIGAARGTPSSRKYGGYV
jgi:hypothetical protein